MSASDGTLSTDVLITVIPKFKGLILFLNFVAPIALEPIPASQENTIFFTTPGIAPVLIGAEGAAVPFASAFIFCI